MALHHSVYLPRELQHDPGEGTIEDFAAKCEAHKSHRPTPRYLELHHVVPQSWQKFWQPEGAKIDSEDLWDPREIALCRTGHGNVHYWLVRFMRQWAVLKDIDKAVSAAIKGQTDVHLTERGFAKLGMIRWQETGGDLKLLTDAKRWGGMYG